MTSFQELEWDCSPGFFSHHQFYGNNNENKTEITMEIIIYSALSISWILLLPKLSTLLLLVLANPCIGYNSKQHAELCLEITSQFAFAEHQKREMPQAAGEVIKSWSNLLRHLLVTFPFYRFSLMWVSMWNVK